MNDRDESLMGERCGFVFQFYNLIPNLNVEENIILPILLDGKKIKDYKINSIILKCSPIDRRYHTLENYLWTAAKGVIARALINERMLFWRMNLLVT